MDSNHKGLPDYLNSCEINGTFPDLSFMDLPFDPPDLEWNHFDLSFTPTAGVGPFDPSNEAVDPSPGGGESSDVSLGLSSNPEGEAASPGDSDSSSDPILKYIGDMLLEEDIEDRSYMFDDLIALTATEKSLYDVLGQQYPPLVSSNVGFFSNHDKVFAGNTNSSIIPSIGIGDAEVEPSTLQAYLPDGGTGDNDLLLDLLPSENASSNLYSSAGGFSGTSASEMVQQMFSDRDSALLYKKGLEEASKFLPSPSPLVIDLDSYKFALAGKKGNSESTMKENTLDKDSSVDLIKCWKTHEREDSDLDEGRSRKQSAISRVQDDVSERDGDLSDMFDKVLLFPDPGCNEHAASGHGVAQNTDPENGRAKREGKKESVDLTTLLVLCAQAMSTSDFRTTNELLRQIRQDSSPHGDGSQRLAHYFAIGLEARLAGSTMGAQSFFHSQSVKKFAASVTLKGFQTLVSSSPFKKLAIFHANKMILHASEKATTLHIVDFGIIYGFHWPILIEFLSSRPGGPPKLRITGIELPQRGFKPAERIEETGRRLAKYCKRFNVPFEYHPIAQRNWENIRIEDLNLKNDEFLAVNSLCRFRNLLDETDEEGDCPRDDVLNLIRKMNPGIFCFSVINGFYNSPFFVTRFREALFHFSSVYDIFHCTLARDDLSRETVEAEFYGREAINAIACEGPERVERPETYKQWQARTLRAGFKPVPLDPELLSQFRDKMKSHYHKDFMIDRDGDWMLQGWKGRILYASSCWVPA